MCTLFTNESLIADDAVQSKEKFLSAASSDGFNFCSVILYSIYAADWTHLNADVCFRLVDGTYTILYTPESCSYPTGPMDTAISSHPSILLLTGAFLGRTTYRSSSSLSWTPTPRSLSVPILAVFFDKLLLELKRRAGDVLLGANTW